MNLKMKTDLQNNTDAEEIIMNTLEQLDLEDTMLLLNGLDTDELPFSKKEMRDIKIRTKSKLGLTTSSWVKQKRMKYLVSAAAILLCIMIGIGSDRIVQAFQSIFSLIPGIGIVENNEEIIYRLKEPVHVTTSQGTLDILSANATKDSIGINFTFRRSNYSEEQLIEDKQKEWEDLSKNVDTRKPKIYIIVDNMKYQMSFGVSSSGGEEQTYSYSFEMNEGDIDLAKSYTLFDEELNISADFQLVSLEQYSDLNEIGATDIHNNISLTATASLVDHQLNVNVYPINDTDYTLISFNREYDLKYFGKKMVLKTDMGDMNYTLPEIHFMNTTYSFPVDDTATEYVLSIPFVVVESKEEKKLTMPIPKEGEVIELNKEIAFEKGSVIIKSVEKVVSENGNEYGDLKVSLEYISQDENQQLIGVELTRKASEGYSVEYDNHNRVCVINYMLEKSDHRKLKLYVIKPRYAFMDEYNLDIKVQ